MKREFINFHHWSSRISKRLDMFIFVGLDVTERLSRSDSEMGQWWELREDEALQKMTDREIMRLICKG
jgi:hypothetical protein